MILVTTRQLQVAGLSRKMAAEIKTREFVDEEHFHTFVKGVLLSEKNRERQAIAEKNKPVVKVTKPARKSIDFLDFETARTIMADGNMGAWGVLNTLSTYADAITLLGVLSRKYDWRGWEIMVAYEVLGHKTGAFADFIREPDERTWHKIDSIISRKRKQ